MTTPTTAPAGTHPVTINRPGRPPFAVHALPITIRRLLIGIHAALAPTDSWHPNAVAYLRGHWQPVHVHDVLPTGVVLSRSPGSIADAYDVPIAPLT